MNTSSIKLAQPRVQIATSRGSRPSNSADSLTDRRQYQCFYVLCFAIFLPVALLSRLLPRAWRPFTQAGDQRSSVINEVHNAVSAVLPFVFMA